MRLRVHGVEHGPVTPVDAEFGHAVLVQHDDVVVTDLVYIDVGFDVDGPLVRVLATGLGIEVFDHFDHALQRLHVDAQGLGDLDEMPLHEVVPVIADDGVDERYVDLQEVKLQEQAFAQVAGADADGVERLNGLDGPLDLLCLVRARGKDLFGGSPQVPVRSGVAGNAGPALRRRGRGVAQAALRVLGHVPV